MKAGVRPLSHLLYETMLDWIEMQVIHLTAPIRFIADQVLPKAGLPYACVATDSIAAG